jgi:hypothetical protein
MVRDRDLPDAPQTKRLFAPVRNPIIRAATPLTIQLGCADIPLLLT